MGPTAAPSALRWATFAWPTCHRLAVSWQGVPGWLANRWADQIIWFYFWQMKHPIWADHRTSVFATYGTSGWVERQSVFPGRLVPIGR